MGLSDIRYLARSKRPLGAYTFSAVDRRDENVILKVQPREELMGYVRAQALSSRLPERIARHMPVIYSVRTLAELGVDPPRDETGTTEDLGIVVMERLDELPGNMFDLITQPASKSSHSLESLMHDHSAFSALVDEAIAKSRRAIESAVAGAPRKSDAAVEMKRLRNMLVSVSYAPPGDVGTVTVDDLNRVVTDKVTLWFKGLGVTRPGVVQSLAKMLMSTVSSQLGRRAVPKEPTRDVAGPLGRIRGVSDLVRAIEELKAMDMSPSDVHGNNIMVRPDSGELVISDLGHFV
jgi:hypothetical protein